MRNLLLFGNLGMGEILVIALIILLLFGGKKIPELMRGVGKGVKSFKEGINGIEDDLKTDADSDRDVNKEKISEGKDKKTKKNKK
ncbi:MAG: twin-arginine translocase TatA/TatE family subunit [Bacteroidales bacterium]|jgi:sec-independent protein translocase protein TatA|nr:twin-arginine translocase TatA/TatE family subunit [Bacteroidales bacterium]